MLSPKLETERLILRRYKESDIDAIYEIITDERLSEYIKFPNLTKDSVRSCLHCRFCDNGGLAEDKSYNSRADNMHCGLYVCCKN